jgi:hypothetical protein
MKNVALFILCILLFVQCTGKKSGIVEDTIGYEFEVQENISFEEIPFPDLLGSVMQLLKVDDLLLINDFHGDSLVHIYNLKTHQKMGYLVSAGNGPNELIAPLELQMNGGNLWILSRPLHMLSHISCADIAKNGTVSLVRDGSIKGEADCFVPLDVNHLVYSGFFTKRYALANTEKLGEVQEFGDYPDFWESEKDFPVEAKAMFHQSRFAVNPTDHLFASCSYFALEIYSYDTPATNVPELKFRKQLGRYEYDYQSGGAVSTSLRAGSDLAAVDVVNGGKYMYVLIQDEENRKHRNIMVLDWEGNPVKLLKSGKRITCLAVDEKEGVGYCIIRDPEDTLVSFKLSI